MATDAEWAWLAGIYEGEGSLAFTGKNSVTLHIGMTDADIIKRVHELAGVGTVYTFQRDSTKAIYAWRTGAAQDVKPVLEAIRPWLGARRAARVDVALERLSHVRQRGYCKRGHRLAGENLYRAPGGQEHCRACRQVRDAARHIIKT